ncbi:MAG: 4-hydroxy-3-methylbut-2-enyl diphosphate reductase [Candidatus Muiribacteriota bacterium]
MKRIIKIADKAGFCFGVERAEKIAFDTLNKFKKNIYTLGPLIHNPLVVKALEEKGIYEVSEDIIKNTEKGSTLIIRSHGIEKDLKEKLTDKGYNVVDATCPFVKKAKEVGQDYYDRGYKVIILGDKNHPEVKGIHSYTDYKGIIIKNEIHLKEILPDINGKIGIIAQTTQNKETFEKCVNLLKKDNREFTYYYTICSATQLRQESAISLAGESDCMIVVGGYNSANTKRLVEICKQICKNVIWIEKAEELNFNTLKKYKKIGITAGASTPIWSIKKTYDRIKLKFQEEKVY